MSSNLDYPEEAIPLISVTDSNTLALNPQALKILDSIEKPLAVVGVAGKYRTGKSYLLNRVILNKNKGFGVGPTINPCTKGVWMWSKPLKGQTAEGEIVNVVVLDSEGLAAVDQDSGHDARVFSLVMLLCSSFIYNSMGSIDESALENLSLVVNLTKNIHIKSAGNEELDFDDFAFYMPHFTWVVRDFALELVDGDGNPVTSKQYLESALVDQHGFSEQIEEKNLIRGMLRTFFKHRTCFTMVRPLTDEAALRNLETTGPEKLRPEFVEQVVELRKQILSQAKKKCLNGAELNGKMLSGLLNNYIDAINSKDIPNIETAWDYICDTQCRKAVEDGLKEYEEEMKNALEHSFPTSKRMLKEMHLECKEEALRGFNRQTVGDGADQFKKELLEGLQERYETYKTDNEQQFEDSFIKEMNDGFSGIQEKIRTRAYGSVFEFQQELSAFESFFLDYDPNGPNKNQLLYEFIARKTNEFVHSLNESLNQFYGDQLVQLEGKKNKLETELKGLKENHGKEKASLENRLGEVEGLNKELTGKVDLVNSSIRKLKAEKLQNEKALADKLNDAEGDHRKTIDELRVSNKELMEKAKGLERELMLKESDFDKKTALYEQKVNFCEERLNLLNGNEEKYNLEIHSTRNELNTQIQDMKHKYEEELLGREKETANLKERLVDLEEERETIEKKNQTTIADFKKKEGEYKKEIERMKDKLEEFEVKFDGMNNSGLKTEQIENMMQELESVKETLKFEKSEKNSLSDKMNQLKKDFEKEKAMIEQKNVFLETKNEDVKRQLAESKKLYQETLNALESTANNEKTDFHSQLQEITETHKKEVKSLERQFEGSKTQYKEEIERLTDKLGNLEKDNEEEVEKYKSEFLRYKESYETIEREKISLKRQLHDLEGLKDEIYDQCEEQSAVKIETLEREIEELKAKNAKETSQNQKKMESTFNQMKEFFEGEKVRLEKKIQTEKEKANARLEEQNEEFEERLTEERNNFEEETENLKNDFNEYIISSNANAEQLKNGLINAETQIEHYRAEAEKISEDYERLKSDYDLNVEGLKETLEKEKKELKVNLEKIKEDYREKDKECWNLIQKLEGAQNELNKANDRYNLKMKPLEEENKNLKIQFDELKEKFDKINDENIDHKIEFGKKIALSKQKNDFLTKRVDELQKQVDSGNRKIDEKLKEQRQEFSKEKALLKQRHSDEKKELETRYENKRKALKESENYFNEKLSFAEKSKNELTEKFNAFKAESVKTETKIMQENESMKSRLETIETSHAETLSSLQGQLDGLKTAKYGLEMDIAEVKANYEKDEALWKGKFVFQEEQKEQLTKELGQSQMNFDLMLQKLQKVRSSEKEETTTSQKMTITNIEQRYNAQINELNEKHKAMVESLEERNTKLEREIKSLNEKLLSENNAKLANYGNIEKKLNDYIENEKILQEQIAKTKQNRDNRIMELNRKHDEVLQTYKAKLTALEDKGKEIENNKSVLLLEHEKEKTKWRFEKESLVEKNSEYNLKMERLERKKENLLRENEKLKNENRKNKKLLGNGFSSGLGGKFANAMNMSKFNERSFVTFESKIPSMKQFVPKGNVSKGSFLNENNQSVDSQKEDDILKNLQ